MDSEPTCYSETQTTKICRSVIHLRNALVAQLDSSLDACGLTAAQYGVLINLVELKTATPAQLCESLAYDKGAMSRMLKRLESKSLIYKKPQTDGRSFVVALTEQGALQFSQAHKCVTAVFAHCLAPVEPAELTVLDHALSSAMKTF
ncbi:MarR family transcriptional regulator [Alteromonas sp. C1M14]|uniref:MarR family winged helix-turn-helix transcriptional regulator n=1 Tax=Alteromonas sp. C1M14 TaxID=2841567 RepID=UPI001C09587A|nr:MarR family transcriptional regulator [Alteromonas sp. C1M14]MBU2978118.1 MarR family transcriptional regulator [Alteromonas sp. C1M14]